MDQQGQFPDIAERLNQVRIARALALLSPLQKHLFRLIPFLIQQNSVQYPGFVDPNTPSGIQGYSPESFEAQACDVFKLPFSASEAENPAFEGVYAMGSTASFGQNAKSDVDVWLVHHAQLCDDDLASIKLKTERLTAWFAEYQFEVNFYLVHPQQFCGDMSQRSGCQSSMAHEHSGSTQHWLLLEEFYRSQIRLAGKTIAWWPDAKLNPELLYLGNVHELPASEYFGASLWQLYKGLNKPHKALIKVLLLEAYASEYPHSQLLCDRLWQKTLAGDFSTSNDAYYAIYEVIEAYLLKQNDNRRLEIVRRCFYLKCGVYLSVADQGKDWRYAKMQKLVQEWQWPDSLISTLDDCEHWHSGQLNWFNEQLNELLLASYQTLLRFASTHELNEGLRIEELGMLTRKLHTYFSQDEDQIAKLNLLWSRSVAESEVTMVSSTKENQYYLYRQGPKPQNLLGESAICKGKTPSALMIWACLNGVSTPETKWYEFGQSKVKSRRLTEASRRLLNFIDHDWRVSKLDLCQPWHFRKLIFVLNLDCDPTVHWHGQEMMVDVMNANVFSLGRKKENMLGALDAICLNSWGEWQCHRFEGETAVLQALSFVTPGLRRATHPVDMDVISCSQKLRPQLKLAVKNLLKQTVRLCQQVQQSSTLVQPLQISHTRYGIFFNPLGMAYQDLSDAKSFYQQLSRSHLVQLPRPELGDDPFSSMPKIIQNFAAKGAIQYFLRQRPESLDVFILDEDNQLSHYVQPGSNMVELVNKVSHHYVFDEYYAAKARFNIPQFFHLVRVAGELTVMPFGVDINNANVEF
ncbi:class I adenylate cyclase [Shewanella sp. Shew256]|uniref:class I adenylate cyclase n=1 Tax=Shewanella sp. Shew256 TaxID=1969376 RepID=UPI000B49B9DA|nr:class I adenylate cyclase [Shewanella sp. Shew256]